ncbi:hypothetical protein Tco_0838475 [Tanacetum coccineum]|uniref:Xylulose kinase-1 n=1 Tax=Tanacetum coccineum TaxID=301880 RepID=A0ABQ5ANT7_9ASTR
MVAYLKKPTGSEGFQEIVDFLNGDHIRYALTKNPTIYVSLIEKFWQTATVRAVDNGEQEITATVDGKEFTITEVSVRRHLQLADVDGISVLPTTEIFDQLSLIGNMKRGFSGEHTPLFLSMLAIQEEEGEGSGHPYKPQPPPSTAQPTHEEPIPNVVSSSHQMTQTPRQALNKVTKLPQTSEPIPNVADEVVYEEWDDRVERATTTAASLDVEQASGNINRTQSTAMPNVSLPQGIGAGGSPRCQEAMGGFIAQTRSERVPTPPYDSPLPRVNTLGSDEGSMSLQELTVLCTTLSSKVESLEADLKQTKQVYSAAYTKLIMKVKKLEKTAKTRQAIRRAKFVVSDDEEEDPSKQGRSMIEEIDQDAGVTLVTPIQVSAQGEAQSQEDQPEDYGRISTTSRLFSTAEESVSTVDASMPVSTAGKGKMEESEDEQTKRTKLQQEQDRLGHKAAMRLQEELDEEERQWMARVHEATQYFTEEEWENIRARVEADEELTRRLQAEERNKYSEVDQAKMLQLRIYSFDELKELFETTMNNVNAFIPMETEDRGRALELAVGSSQATITNSAEVGSSKRAAELELDHEGSKKQKANEASGSVQEQPDEKEKELSQEDLQQMMMVVLVEEVYVEALQVKYPIIDWEEILKVFDRDDLVMLWSLVKERFSSTEPTDDKERALWVELKRLFELDANDELWKLQRYMHDPLTWRLYDTCGVHHVFTEKGMDIFMLVEKEYPLSKGIMIVILVNKLKVDQHLEMANDLLRKIFIQVRRPRH